VKQKVWYKVYSVIFADYLSKIITNKMKKGTVKFFNEAKGFGFVRETSTGQEYFVHATGLIDKVRENDEITFDLKEGRKGLNAVDVKLAK
jgi:CspA family cold shock protein